VGHTYGARTTPHMFVIDKTGALIYAGGIDNKPSPNVEDIKSATNYVTAALDEADGGQAGDDTQVAAVWVLGEVREQLTPSLVAPADGIVTSPIPQGSAPHSTPRP